MAGPDGAADRCGVRRMTSGEVGAPRIEDVQTRHPDTALGTKGSPFMLMLTSNGSWQRLC